jgi:hypothetical protein
MARSLRQSWKGPKGPQGLKGRKDGGFVPWRKEGTGEPSPRRPSCLGTSLVKEPAFPSLRIGLPSGNVSIPACPEAIRGTGKRSPDS